MRRLCTLSLLSVMVALGLSACGRETPPAKERADLKVLDAPDKDKDKDKGIVKDDKDKGPDKDGKKEKEETAEDKAKRDKYEASLAEALTLLGEAKHAEALVALETARTFDDNEFVRDEIAKLKTRLEARRTAKKSISDIEAILDDGKAEEASRLARDAFKEFGDDKVLADKLAKLRLEADALVAVGKKEDAGTRFDRFKKEGDAALKEENLRAAALAFEGALAAKEDAALRKEVEALRDRLEKYDGLRARAAELKRDPPHLEEALAALEEAKAAWKTLQVLTDIDECTALLAKRRDTVSVADFEVRGDTGIADAGKTLAEELLPRFKSRFDLVERAEVHKIVRELKLEETFADDVEAHRAVGKLAKVRYLVLGSIRRDAGLTVNARLVDVRTGLIVQTAKIVVPGPDELWPALPDLAKQLLMSDEEKEAFEAERIRVAEKPAAVVDEAPLPPPPALPDAGAIPPSAILVHTPVPPAFGGLKVADFDRLPPPPPPGKVAIFAHGGGAELSVKHKLLHATLLLGDNLFRRGHYREAHRHFDFALQLAPGDFDILVRLDRCGPHVPPPVVVLPEPVVIVPAKPRIAILNFITIGDPRAVPPYLSHWTPYHLAPYFRYQFDIVDPGEVYWYMAKMGLNLGDLMNDPFARRWLGRALGVRYFVLGTIHETASFQVNAYLLDAEFGFQAGHGRLKRVHHPFELKLRLEELARRTMLSPRERETWVDDDDRFEVLVVKGRKHHERGEFALAINVFEDALRIRPRHVEVLVYLDKSRHGAHLAALEAERHKRFLIHKALEEDARRRHFELARQAELARLGIVGGPVFIERREPAAVHLVEEARIALKFKNFSLSITKFESALRLAPARDEWNRELAIARLEADKHARHAAAEATALHAAEHQRRKEAELLKANALLAEQKRLAEATLLAERKAREAADDASYRAAFDEGQRLLVKNDFDGAISALQTARRYKKTDAVEALLNQAFVRRAETAAAAKGEAERLALEKKLADERIRRKAAEAEAKRNQDLYQQALELAHKALEDRKFEVAEQRFEEAGKLFKTDAVLAGLKRAESGKRKAALDKEAALKKAAEEAGRAERLKKLVTEGNAFLEAKAYKKAVEAFLQAKGLAPENVDVLTGLSKAQQAEERALIEARRKTDEAVRLKEFDRLVTSGQANLDAKQFEAAALAFEEALKLRPADATAKSLLATAEKGRATLLADAKAKAESERKAAAYQKLLLEGKAALAASRFDDAIKAFSDAQKVLPGDKSSSDYLAEARASKTKHEEAVALAAKKRAEDLTRAADLKKALDQGRTALAAGDFGAANKALALATKLDAKSADVSLFQDELRRAEKAALAVAEAEKKRRTDYLTLVDKARTAWKAGQFDDALKTLVQAGTLIPEGKEANDLMRQVQKSREEALKAGEEKMRLAQLDKLLTTARALLKAGDLDAAAKLLAQADKLAPKDAGVAKAFDDLKKARVLVEEKADLAKRKVVYDQAVAAGQKALMSKQFDQAIKLFGDALKVMPGDAGAERLLKDARKAWDDAKADAADLAKRKTVYEQAVAAGQKALMGKQFDQAVKLFGDALKVMPGDTNAERLLKDAQKAWDDAKAGAADLAKRQAIYDKAFAAGQKALMSKQFDEAIKLLGDALKVMPGDANAERLLKDARKAWDDAKAGAEDLAKRKAIYDKAFAAGQKALMSKRYDEAIKLLGDALKVMPGDANAERLLKDARKAWDDAKAGAEDLAKRKAIYDKAVSAGQKALMGKQFDQAVKLFGDALKVMPGDTNAERLLKDAQRAWDDAKKAPLPVDPKAGLPKLLSQGADLEKENKWQEAFKVYQEADKLAPKDAKIDAALKRTEFTWHFTEGQKHLDAKRFAEAVTELEAALRVSPGNPAATKLLEQAKKKTK